MNFNFKVLGASMLSTGPLFVKFGGHPAAWWVGVIFTTLGPVFISIAAPLPKRRRKPRTTKRKTRRKP